MLFVLFAATATIDAAASIIRYARLQSGLDLAIFDQAVWHYSRLEAPFSSIEAKNLLGDHFHPLVAGLAPLYWVWSDPRMLLIGQSVLVAASIIPVFLFARPRLGRLGAYLLAGAYAAYWGIQVGVMYEFHEVALAPLLIALAILLADRRRWGWFWLVIVLLLGVKEDLSILVAFFGLYLLSRREVRQGVSLVVVGIAWYELSTRVFIPHFASGAAYAHWTYGSLGRDLPDAVWALVQAPWRVFTIGFSPGQKAQTIAGLLAPFLFLSLGSRVFFLAVPLLAERFLSTNPQLWSSHFHYSLSIASVLAMGAADALARLSRLVGDPRRTRVVIGTTGAMLVASLAITRLAAHESALSQITRPSFLRTPAYANGAYRALRRVPAEASLATTDFVLPHASERRQVELLDRATAGRDEYVLVQLLDPGCCGDTGNRSYAELASVVAGELARTTPVYYHGGWLVARRPPAGGAPDGGVLTPMSAALALRVGRTATRLAGELGAGGLGACYAASAAGASSPGASAACFATTSARFTADATRLTETIAGQTLAGGCAELATAAVLATQRRGADLAAIARTAATTSGARVASASAAAQADENGQGLSGQLELLVVLCTPRRSAAG